MDSFVQARADPLALLLFPPVYDFALYDLFLKPYGLLRIAAWLAACGYRVRLVNALDYTDPLTAGILGRPRREPRGTGKFFRQVVTKPALAAGMERSYARYGIAAGSLEQRIAAERPDVVLVSGGMTYWYPGVFEAIRTVRRIHPGVAIVLGGIYPTLCPQHARAHSGADLVVQGAAFEALDRFLRRRSLPAAGGSAHRGAAFKVASAEKLLLLPEANWQAGVLRLNRGCPHACAYCSSKVIEPRFQPGSAQLLFDTVRELHRRFSTRSFAFYDDALLCNKELGFLPFLERICGSDMRLSFYLPNAVHLGLLDRRSARLMREAGFAEVRFGFESAEGEFHRTLDRKLETSMLAEGLEHLLQAGFEKRRIGAYVLAGLPGQEAAEVEQTIRHVADLGIRPLVAEYSPTPGSALWPQAVRQSSFDLEGEPLTHNNSLLPMRWSRFTLEDLDRLKRLSLNRPPRCRRLPSSVQGRESASDPPPC